MEFSDAINSVTFNKNNLIRDENGDIIKLEEKGFPSFVIQKLLSYHIDTLFFVAYLNQLTTKKHGMTNGMAYEFLLHTLPKGKRFTKIPKTKPSEVIEIISEMQKCSYEKAKQIYSLLNKSQIEQLLTSKGNIKK